MVDLGAVLELRVKDVKRALETYDEILSRNPQHKDALEAVARLAESRGAWDKAERALGSLLDVAGTSVELALRLANARKESSATTSASKKALKRAPTVEPTNETVRESASRSSTNARRSGRSSRPSSPRTRRAFLAQEAGGMPESDRSRRRCRSPRASRCRHRRRRSASKFGLLRRAADIHLKERGVPADVRSPSSSGRRSSSRSIAISCSCSATSTPRRSVIARRPTSSSASLRPSGASARRSSPSITTALASALGALGDKDAAALAQFDMAFKIDPGSIEVLRDLPASSRWSRAISIAR